MENEILENGTTPETEEVVETVEAVETAAAEAAPEAEKTSVVDTVKGVANNAVAKGKALWADRENLLAKAKELPGKLKTVPKKIWMMIGGGVAALIALIVVLSLLGNTYKTPVKLLQAVENNKNAAAYYNKQVKAVNGLCESELKTIMNIFKKTDDYDDAIDELKDAIDEAKDTYGNNYKYKYKIVDKEKIDKDELKDTQKSLRSQGKSMYNEYDDLDSDDYEDLADDMDITKGQAKKVAKAAKKIGKTLKGAKITKGYKLTVEVTLTGSEVEDAEPVEKTIYVYKVNGRWISSTALSMLIYAV